MIQQVSVVGVCLAGVGLVGSLALSSGQEGVSTETVEAGPTPAAAPRVPETPGAAGLGMRCEPVPAELATHLGLARGVGSLVVAVKAGSPAAASGLERFDVILTVGGESAGVPRMREALGNAGGLGLRIVRAGLARDLTIPATGEGGSGFLSSADLAPDHPFRRLARIESLRASYSSKAGQYAERVRDLEQQSREAREEAKREMAALEEACREQALEYLAAREQELLRIVDEHLSAERVEPLRELRVELGQVLEAERTQAVGALLARLEADLAALPGENAGQGDAPALARAHARLARVGDEAAGLVGERVRRPWKEGRTGAERHRERLGPKHDARMDRAAEAVAAIRAAVRDRVTCAVRRAGEELAKDLRGRLRKMDVPRPGEIEAALDDVQQQLEVMTWRFVRRTEYALDSYMAEVGRSRETLLPALARHLAASEAAAEGLDAAIDAALASHAPGGLALVDGWRGRAAAEAEIDGLAAELRAAANAGRDAMRPGALGLARDLGEQRVVADDAWKDLQQLLGALRGQASNDCWKLDGPHLDGRFPTPAEPPARDVSSEVAMAQ